MNITSHKGWNKEANGTSLTGYVTIDYDTLVEALGPPVADNDGYKVDAEWHLTFTEEGGHTLGFVTIYNYKTGRNYLKEDGQDVEDITTWHIGSKSPTPLFLLQEYFEENDIRGSITLDR
tara:strand:- start:791 stop:1150 length:360 start_codon:yes stop_codon:yes gene_type:complete